MSLENPTTFPGYEEDIEIIQKQSDLIFEEIEEIDLISELKQQYNNDIIEYLNNRV